MTAPGPDYAERVALAIPLDALARRLNYHAANCLTNAESLTNFRAAMAVEMRRAAAGLSAKEER
jgi:hypothetical protein